MLARSFPTDQKQKQNQTQSEKKTALQLITFQIQSVHESFFTTLTEKTAGFHVTSARSDFNGELQTRQAVAQATSHCCGNNLTSVGGKVFLRFFSHKPGLSAHSARRDTNGLPVDGAARRGDTLRHFMCSDYKLCN